MVERLRIHDDAPEEASGLPDLSKESIELLGAGVMAKTPTSLWSFAESLRSDSSFAQAPFCLDFVACSARFGALSKSDLLRHLALSEHRDKQLHELPIRTLEALQLLLSGASAPSAVADGMSEEDLARQVLEPHEHAQEEGDNWVVRLTGANPSDMARSIQLVRDFVEFIQIS